MLEKSFGLLFYLKKPKNYQNGPVPVYLRITVSGTPKELSLKRSWESERWNAEPGKAIGTKEDARQLNNYLNTLYIIVQEIRRKLIDNNKIITSEAIINALNGKNEDQHTVVSIFMEHNERMKNLVGKEYSPRTLQRFETTLAHLRAFMLSKYQKSDFNIKVGVSKICYTLFRGKIDHLFAGKEMQLML